MGTAENGGSKETTTVENEGSQALETKENEAATTVGGTNST